MYFGEWLHAKGSKAHENPFARSSFRWEVLGATFLAHAAADYIRAANDVIHDVTADTTAFYISRGNTNRHNHICITLKHSRVKLH